MSDFNSAIATELKKFEKANFNIDNILATAERLKYTSGIKKAINKLIEDPAEDFVRIVSSEVYEGRFTANVKEMLAGVTKSAFRDVIMDAVKHRLSNALADTQQVVEQIEQIEEEPAIVTTDEEVEGFMIVRAICREVVPAKRVTMRDAKSYCAILLDDNNRKPIVRLHFNRATKYVGIFDGDTEERIIVESLDQIYEFADRIRSAAQKYA